MALESELKKDNASVHSNNDDSAKSTKEEGQVTPVSAYIQLWSFATPLDTVLRTIAALCSAGSGTAEPLMAIFFGNLVNLFNGTEELTPDEFRRRVNRNSLYFVYLFIGKFFVSDAFPCSSSHSPYHYNLLFPLGCHMAIRSGGSGSSNSQGTDSSSSDS